MGKSYTSTIQLACWKEHTCKSCGGIYAYELKRKVTGSSSNADKAVLNARQAAAKAMREEVDAEPCPSCGAVQPDMIAQSRRRTHWLIFWIALGVLALLLILRGVYVLTANNATWAIAGACALAALLILINDFRNPNRDLDSNRQRGMQRASEGLIRHTPGRAPAGPRGIGARDNVAPRTIVQTVTGILVVVAVLLAAAPEILRAKNAWPLNAVAYPPVVGPGDHTRIYMPGEVTSIKGYWRGKPHATLHAPGLAAEGIPVVATTNQNDWGSKISAKSSEKSSSSTPWVELDIPANPALAGAAATCDVELELAYPQMSGSKTFQTVEDLMEHSVQFALAPAGAGTKYNAWWWEASLAASGLILLSALLLVIAARSLERQAVPAPRVLSPDAPTLSPPPLPNR